MTQWQYRLRYTNLPAGEGGPDALWHDAGTYRIENIQNHCVLEWRRKPRSLAALLRRPGRKRERGGKA